MAKGKGFDPIEDANEVAHHNINPYYWVNRVTSYTYARWMAAKKLAVITLPMYVIFWAALIWGFADASASQHISIWKLLFDFSDRAGLAIVFWVGLMFLAFLTVIQFIMVFQLIFARQPKPATVERRHKKEKRQPRRRKDWH